MAIPVLKSIDYYSYDHDMMRRQMEQEQKDMMRQMQMVNRNPYESQAMQQVQQQPESKAQDKRLLLLEV